MRASLIFAVSSSIRATIRRCSVKGGGSSGSTTLFPFWRALTAFTKSDIDSCNSGLHAGKVSVISLPVDVWLGGTLFLIDNLGPVIF